MLWRACSLAERGLGAVRLTHRRCQTHHLLPSELGLPSSALTADRGRVDLVGCRRAVPAASLPVNFLFWRTFCSGAALVPGAHCSHRRTILWQLSVFRTPVALPPSPKPIE